MVGRPVRDDADLGRGVAAGDPAAFAELYERYARGIHDFVAGQLGDRQAAEDLTQATFVRALERRQTLRQPAAVRSWLYSIALNLARNRRSRVRELAALDELFAVASPLPGPEAADLQREHVRLVWTAAIGLEPRQYAVLDLTVRHGMSTAEVATALGVSVRHAAVLVHRAHAALANAVRALLVARSRTHCPQLAGMVPAGVRALGPAERRTVDHHLRRCAACQACAARLTRPAELLGGIAILPLPAAMRWPPPGFPAPGDQTAPVGVQLRMAGARIPRVGIMAGGLAVFLGLGYGLIHVLPGHGSAPSLPSGAVTRVAARPIPATSVASPLTNPTPAPSLQPSPQDLWDEARASVASASSYHIAYYNESPAVTPSIDGPPVITGLEVDMLGTGDYRGNITFNNSFMGGGEMQIARVRGVTYVRGFVGSLGAPVPVDDYSWFGLTTQQRWDVSGKWLACSGPRQAAAVRAIDAVVQKYALPSGLAATLSPQGPLALGEGEWVGPTNTDDDQVTDGTTMLTVEPLMRQLYEMRSGDADVIVTHYGSIPPVSVPSPVLLG